MNHIKIEPAFLLALTIVLLGPGHLDARRVAAGPDEVVEVRARLRFATTVVLPDDEKILDWVCGDAEYWSVQGAANLAFVKPTAEGIRTNVTLVTDKGHVYTLLFRELGDEPGEPDLKLLLGTEETPDRPSGELDPLRFEPRGSAALFERQAAEAREQARQAAERAQRQIVTERDRFRAEYPRTMRFDYVVDRRYGDDPFKVVAMWRDDRFTYIRAQPEEAPALYEERDGQPSLVPYDFADGLYVTRRPLADGWLQIGKRRLRFRRIRR